MSGQLLRPAVLLHSCIAACRDAASSACCREQRQVVFGVGGCCVLWVCGVLLSLLSDGSPGSRRTST